MGFRVSTGESAAEALVRMILEQIDSALLEFSDASLDRHESLHQVRKRNKKVRALLRLGRGALEDDRYRAENAWFRDTSRLLSALRDETGLIEAMDRLKPLVKGTPAAEMVARQRQGLLDRRSPETALAAPLRQAAGRLRVARRQIESWQFEGTGFGVFADGIRRVYRRAQREFAHALAEPSDEALHAWRKRVKYHGYHIRVLCPISPLMLNGWRDRVLGLSEVLGEDHDLAVLRQVLLPALDAQPDVAAAFTALVAERRRTLQGQAFAEGRKLFADPPDALIDRLRPLWSVWGKAGRPA